MRLLLCFAAAIALTARAEIVSKTVEYREGDTVLEGLSVYDDSKSGQRPAVLCVELDRPALVMNLWLVDRLRRAGYVLVHLEERNLTLLHPEKLAAWTGAGAG